VRGIGEPQHCAEPPRIVITQQRAVAETDIDVIVGPPIGNCRGAGVIAQASGSFQGEPTACPDGQISG